MADERLPLSELLEKAGEGDFLRAVAEAVLQLLMEADVEGLIGAGRYERNGERMTWRNGYRDRALDTRLGSLHSARTCRFRQQPPLHFVHRAVSKPVFNPVDRLRFGAVGCKFCYPYAASIIPARAEAVHSRVVAPLLGRARNAQLISCAASSLLTFSSFGFVSARAAVDSSAMPPGAAPQTNQKDRTDAHEYPRPAGPVIAPLPPGRRHARPPRCPGG